MPRSWRSRGGATDSNLFMHQITDFADHLECPSVNGILFADGTVQCLNVAVEWGPPAVFTIDQGEQTSLQRLEEIGHIHWKSCCVLAKLYNEPTGLEILAGESTWGSDGFVAVLNASSRQLVWLALLDCSNPFCSLSIHGEMLQAISTMGYIWTFPLYAPASCFAVREGSFQ